MLKTTRSSVALASRVDGNKIIGDGGDVKVESGGSIVKQKVVSI